MTDRSAREDSDRSLEAVIFDGDGVLIRSMERNVEAYQRALGSVGIRIRAEEIYENEGRRSNELIALLANAHGVALSSVQLEELTREHQRVFASFGTMPLYSDAESVVRRITRIGIRVALVTANRRQNALRNLGPLLPLLDAVVTAEDVTRTKPDPEPYRAALSKLGVRSSHSVVVENSPLGIRSAKSAGMDVVAVTTTNPVGRLALADAIISDLSELPTALARLRWRLDGRE
jgi:HAD superfamily hydrolase (TIGR01509 family)